VQLREKGGKRHAMVSQHNLEEYLVAYLDGAGLRHDPKGSLFPTIGCGTGTLTRTVLPQANAYARLTGRSAGRRRPMIANALPTGAKFLHLFYDCLDYSSYSPYARAQ
jgi:hypothetical protein